MNDFLEYLLKFSLLFSLLIGFYHLVLRKETLHYFKRMYLILTPFVAILLPLLRFQTHTESQVYEMSRPITFFAKQDATEAIAQSFDWQQLLIAVALLCSLVLFFVTLAGIKKVYSYINFSEKKPLDIGVLCDAKEPVSPFSFFQFIVLRSKDHDADELNQIIEHEQVHVYQRHFVDMVIAQLITIFCWWNPLSWFYRHFVVENLEFIVDQEVLRSGVNKKKYQFSILKTSVYDSSMVFANHFNQSLIKKRIEMMNTQLSNPKNLWRTVFVVPLLLLLWVGVGQIQAKDSSVEENAAIENSIKPSELQIERDSYFLDKNTKFYFDNQEITWEEAQKYRVIFPVTNEYSDLYELTKDRPKSWCSSYGLDERGNKLVYIESGGSSNQYTFILDDEKVDKSVIDGQDLFYKKQNTLSKKHGHVNRYFSSEKTFNNRLSENQFQKKFGIFITDEREWMDGTMMHEHNILPETIKDTLPSDTKIYLEGELISHEEMEAIEPDEISSIDVRKEEDGNEIHIRLKSSEQIVVKDVREKELRDEADIYLEGQLISIEEMENIDHNLIESIEVKKNEDEKAIYIKLKHQADIEYIFVDDQEVSKAEFEKKYKGKKFYQSNVIQYQDGEDKVKVRFYYTTEKKYNNRKSHQHLEEKYGLVIPPPPPPAPAPEGGNPPPPPPPAAPNVEVNKLGAITEFQPLWNDSRVRFWYDGKEISKDEAQKYKKQKTNIVYHSHSQETGKAEFNIAIFSKKMSQFSDSEIQQMHPNGRPIPPPPPPPPPPPAPEAGSPPLTVEEVQQHMFNPNNTFYMDGKKVSYEKVKEYYEAKGRKFPGVSVKENELTSLTVNIYTKTWNEYTEEEIQTIKEAGSPPPPPPPPPPVPEKLMGDENSTYYLNGNQISARESLQYSLGSQGTSMRVKHEGNARYTVYINKVDESIYSKSGLKFYLNDKEVSKDDFMNMYAPRLKGSDKVREVYSGEALVGYKIISKRFKDSHQLQGATTQKSKPKKGIYDFAEVAPEYPGGINVLRNHVQENYVVPAVAKEKKLSGTMVTRFVVDTDGSVLQVQILKGIPGCDECGENAISALLNLPEKFTPGLQNGKPVKVRYTVPIVQKFGEETAAN